MERPDLVKMKKLMPFVRNNKPLEECIAYIEYLEDKIKALEDGIELAIKKVWKS